MSLFGGRRYDFFHKHADRPGCRRVFTGAENETNASAPHIVARPLLHRYYYYYCYSFCPCAAYLTSANVRRLTDACKNGYKSTIPGDVEKKGITRILYAYTRCRDEKERSPCVERYYYYYYYYLAVRSAAALACSSGLRSSAGFDTIFRWCIETDRHYTRAIKSLTYGVDTHRAQTQVYECVERTNNLYACYCVDEIGREIGKSRDGKRWPARGGAANKSARGRFVEVSVAS